ncbi:hypothetical protein OY671_007707 [Metschnikowia pulcherrima]|nr:hypothetical protein OY671_007707 [Metschnikowia pulcherrima]
MTTSTNASESRSGYQLRRASAVMMADLARELADLDSRPAEVTTLLVIGENPDCSQTEVGHASAIKRANMVPIIARSMDRGFVARTRADGRSHALTSTDQGRKMADEANQRIAAHEARFVTQLAAGEVETSLRCSPTIRGIGTEPEG